MVALMDAVKAVQDRRQAVTAAQAALEDAQSRLAETLQQTQSYVATESAEREADDAARRSERQRRRVDDNVDMEPMPRDARGAGGGSGALGSGGAGVHGMRGGMAGGAAPAPAAAAAGESELSGFDRPLGSPAAARSSRQGAFNMKPFTIQLSDAA